MKTSSFFNKKHFPLKKELYHTDKSILREVYLEKRKTLSQEEFDAKNNKILDFIKAEFSFKTNSFAHIFLPIEKFREVNTLPIIDFLKAQSQQIVLSKSQLKTNDMQHFLMDENTKLVKNKWGIVEPESGVEIAENMLNIVFVPLLVFDKKGNRIGYGKGYYDKFLSKCNDDCLKIGLSLSPPLDYITCMNPMDVALDLCVCPTNVYEF